MNETSKNLQMGINPIDALSQHLAKSVKRLDQEIEKNIQDKEEIVSTIASHLIVGKGKKIRPHQSQQKNLKKLPRRTISQP